MNFASFKKWGSGAVIASLVCVQSSFAYTTLEQALKGEEQGVRESVKKTDGEVLSEALVNTFDSNFTLTLDSDISADGVDIDSWGDVYTEYIIDATANNVVIERNEGAFSYSAKNANIDFSINSNDDEYPAFFPFKGNINWSEEAVLDFDAFQFAGKGTIHSLEIDNEHIKNIVSPFVEMYELFEGKWIALDFVALKQTFPELEEYITEIQSDLYYEFDIETLEDIVDGLAMGIDFGVATGNLEIEKNGNVYTLTSPDSDIIITLAVTSDNKISSLSVVGNERWENAEYADVYSDAVETGEEYSNVDVNVNVNININFEYSSPKIVFPVIEKQDFDITSFYKLYLEMEQNKILAEQAENQFYKDLNAFEGSATDAIEFLTNGSLPITPADLVFVENYVNNAKAFDRRIRKSDIAQLSVYGLDSWDIDYLYDDMSYNVNDNYNDGYNDKYVLETLIEAFDESGKYHYIDWDIFEELDYSLDTRGDILILLAKVRNAEQLRDQK